MSRPILWICLAAFALIMAGWKWVLESLLASYGWPALIPAIGLLFIVAVLFDRRDARRSRPD
jgi:hypothetical protein